MNISTIARNLVTALVTAVVLLWLWPTAAHAQSSSTTIRGAGLQPLVEESGSSQTLNIYGPGGVIIAQVATDSPAGGTPTTQTRYLLHDHLGSTRVVLDSNNQVLGSFDYSPFGETTPTGNVANVAYRYTGQEVNGALGTYNYHARHYDAGVGRFLRVDPARYNASPYLYANDNPVNFVDQTGQQPILWLISKSIIVSTSQFRPWRQITELAGKLNIPAGFAFLEKLGLHEGGAQSNFSLFIETHADPKGFWVLSDRKSFMTPEQFSNLVYHRLREEDLQSEALESIFLTTCESGCEQNGVSVAERFFRQGLERFPNLERVIASPYKISIEARDGRVHFIFQSPIKGEPNRAIGLFTSYEPQHYFSQDIDETVLRRNVSDLTYLQPVDTDEHTLKEIGEVPPSLWAQTLSEHFSEPLLRTYTRSQVEQRNTLRELPFFSEGGLP